MRPLVQRVIACGLTPTNFASLVLERVLSSNNSIAGFMHITYTARLDLATAGSLKNSTICVEHLHMVEKRPFIAESPAAFETFTAWLENAVRVHSFQQRLSEYTGVSPQNVQRWLDGYIPRNPGVQKLIAEWAQVDYGQLRDLIDKTREQKPPPKAHRVKGITRRTHLRSRGSREF